MNQIIVISLFPSAIGKKPAQGICLFPSTGSHKRPMCNNSIIEVDRAERGRVTTVPVSEFDGGYSLRM